jgi:hypothetical protein
MTLNQRERNLVIGLAAVVALVGVFYVVVKPFLERGATISKDLAKAKQDRDDATMLLDRHPQVLRAWNSMRNTGVLRSDPYEAGQQVINVLQTWAQQSGVTINAANPEPPSAVSADSRPDKPESKFKRVNVHATVLGSTRALSQFLWRVESSPMVLRITQMQVTSKKEATDDLQLQLTLSTLSPLPDTGKTAKPGSGQAGRGPVANATP